MYLDIGQRLRKIREDYSDLSQRAWAEKNGFNVTQYNNWETGTRRIPGNIRAAGLAPREPVPLVSLDLPNRSGARFVRT